MKILAVRFVTSAAGAGDLPRDGVPHVTLVGRSNVGKSSLINALVHTAVARTSAAPGKTRLANLYEVRVAAGPSGAPNDRGGAGRFPGVFYLVDLPGYGYAGGGAGAAAEFDRLTAEYFGAVSSSRPRIGGVIHAVDARHPGLRSDVAAHAWLRSLGLPILVAATKVDRLSQKERVILHRQLVNLMEGPILPVSANTGEGLNDLWKHIITLARQTPG